MSKSVGRLLGADVISTAQSGSEAAYLKYLRNYDSKNVDNAYQNLAATADKLSSGLANRPDYIYQVAGSDDARQRAEQAMYNQTATGLDSQFDARRRQLETRLQNQGISPDSATYQNAMNSLDSMQYNAYTDALQKSILAGQSAYSNSLADQIKTAEFQNSSRQLPIAEISDLLQNQHSTWDVQNQIYDVANKRDTRINNARTQNNAQSFNLGTKALQLGTSAIFSDRELKDQIIHVGQLHNGLPVYLFVYKGDTQPHLGLMAQDVLLVNPDAVVVDKTGFLKVDYAAACNSW